MVRSSPFNKSSFNEAYKEDKEAYTLNFLLSTLFYLRNDQLLWFEVLLFGWRRSPESGLPTTAIAQLKVTALQQFTTK